MMGEAGSGISIHPDPAEDGTHLNEGGPSACTIIIVLRYSIGEGRFLQNIGPQIGRDNPLNLSISLSGGKETNKDSPSSGERRGKSPALNPRAPVGAREL